MTKEEYKDLIIDAVKTLKIDYEDFIGYTFSDDPKIWLENIHKIFKVKKRWQASQLGFRLI